MGGVLLAAWYPTWLTGFYLALVTVAMEDNGRSCAGTFNSLTFLAADSIPWASSMDDLNDNAFSESKRC